MYRILMKDEIKQVLHHIMQYSLYDGALHAILEKLEKRCFKFIIIQCRQTQNSLIDYKISLGTIAALHASIQKFFHDNSSKSLRFSTLSAQNQKICFLIRTTFQTGFSVDFCVSQQCFIFQFFKLNLNRVFLSYIFEVLYPILQ